MFKEIKFKAGRGGSYINNRYRKINKSGDLNVDANDDSIITITKKEITGHKLVIDCDKKTGVFSVRF